MFNILNMLEKYILIKAIQKIISEPGRSFSVRELASSTSISVGASKMALDYMKEMGIVTLKTIGKTYQYRADLENPLCRQWKILFNLDLIQKHGIAENLARKIDNIHAIILYGSFARGTNDERSDIDLLVLAHKPKKIDLGFVNKTGKEANITIMGMKDWKSKAKKDRVFYENVIYDSIVLYGERPVIL